ncbi:MAG: hypothetical protein ABEL76_14885 [Bradymonadaceae bacterium]
MSTAPLKQIDGDNWRDFLEDGTSVLVLTRSDCDACDTYTEELEEFLDEGDRSSELEVGKMIVDEGGLADFKRDQDWVADVRNLPYTAIYVDGSLEKSFPGTGIDRLERRLDRLDR